MIIMVEIKKMPILILLTPSRRMVLLAIMVIMLLTMTMLMIRMMIVVVVIIIVEVNDYDDGRDGDIHVDGNNDDAADDPTIVVTMTICR
jgi:hypothetical protein